MLCSTPIFFFGQHSNIFFKMTVSLPLLKPLQQKRCNIPTCNSINPINQQLCPTQLGHMDQQNKAGKPVQTIKILPLTTERSCQIEDIYSGKNSDTWSQLVFNQECKSNSSCQTWSPGAIFPWVVVLPCWAAKLQSNSTTTVLSLPPSEEKKEKGVGKED